MIAFRKRCPLLRRADFQLNGEGGFHITWHGVKRMKPDWGHASRTVAMQLTQLHEGDARDDLHFIANAYWEDLEFELPQIGDREWFRLVDTAHLATRHRRGRPGVSAAIAGKLPSAAAQCGHFHLQISACSPNKAT